MPDITHGFDRGDGLAGRLGTPTPEGAILVQSANGATTVPEIAIEEYPDSPEIERAEQATITHRFRMSWEECLSRINFLGRGNTYQDSYGNLYLVLSAKIQHEEGGTGTLTVVSEAKSFDSPPDDFSIVPVELGINIIKHPRYFYAFLGEGYGSVTEQQNQMVIRLLQDYFENTSAVYRDAIIKLLDASKGANAGNGTQPPEPTGVNTVAGFYPATALVAGTDMAKRAAAEIVMKYWRGEETPYIVGWQITWSQYYFRPPYMNAGGIMENPITEAVPQLPEYFYSAAFPPDGNDTILDFVAWWNPQSYSDDGTSNGDLSISWLRKADEVEFQRTWFKITRTWIGSPVGFWDYQLYTQNNRPSSPDDYLYVKPS